MMNQQRSRAIERTKYLLFVPLTAVLMLFSNMEAVARLTKHITNAQAASASPEDEAPQKKDRVVFNVVEVMPQYPGGEAALLQYLTTEVKYPLEAAKKGIKGRVSVGFVIDEEGSVSDVEIMRGVDPLLDAEAIRVVKALPKWIPGKQRGKPVCVRFTVPITFNLGEAKVTPTPVVQ